MILVTGSTGQLGQLLIDRLLDRTDASAIIAGARSVDKAAPIAAKGVAIRELDYERPETIATALEGVDKVVLISSSAVGSRYAHHVAVIDAAKKAGVGLIAYTSLLHADPAMLLASEHIATENYLAESGVPYVILRNGWYHENYLANLGATLENGAILGAVGDGVVTPATRNDFAEAAAVVVTEDGHANKVYELGGDTAYTLPQIASIISEVAGKPVAYHDLPAAEYAKTLVGFGVPQPFADVLADSDTAAKNGLLRDTTGDLARLIKRPTTPFADAVRDALA